MICRTVLYLLLALSVTAVNLLKAESVDPGKGLILANDYVRLEFEPENMGLAAMTDLESGYNHILSGEGKHLLWEVAFGKGRQIQRITNNYKPCNYAAVRNLPDGTQRAVMEWNELRWWEEDSVVTVQVTVDLPKDCGVAEWRIFVENLSDYWGLWEAACPAVNGFPAPEKYDVAMPSTGRGGYLLKNWNRKLNARSPSGFFPMQFMSFNHGNNAVYFGSMDGESRSKDFFVDSGNSILKLVRYPENMGVAGSDFPDYYPAAFGVYRGGWVEAAHRYREWALKQIWTGKGPISCRPDFPLNAAKTALWFRDTWVWDLPPGEDKDVHNPFVWKRNARDPHEMNLPFLEAIERLKLPIAFHWYGWHHVLFDNQYPHYLPALPGFKERVEELVGTGSIIMPYINGLSADMNIPDWDKFGPHAVLDEAGGYHQKFYRDGAGRLMPMCPTQGFWHDAITSIVDSLIGYYGANAVYIDEVSCNSDELCFNKDHHHPLGGGKYWADGWRQFYRKVLSVARKKGRNTVITSEAANEIFFDLVTANLFTGRPSDEEIPLMEVVYSGYTLFFGSHCDFRRSSRYFNFAQGQAFIDGRQPGWMNFDLLKPEFSEKFDYLHQCGRYRDVNHKFLTFGRLWGPIEPANAIPQFTEEFGRGPGSSGSVPGAEGRLWQAEDGSLGIVMANYVNEEIPFTYSVNPVDYGLISSMYAITEITPEGRTLIQRTSGTIERTETLGPGKLKVIEISPVSQ